MNGGGGRNEGWDEKVEKTHRRKIRAQISET